MKPEFYLLMLKPKGSQSSGFKHVHQISRGEFKQTLAARKLMTAIFWERKE
jgi:hypothetical protein